MVKTNSITVIAPNAKAQAMWVTMWAALLNVLYSLGFKVEAFEQPAAKPKAKRPAAVKAVKSSNAVKRTPKAKPVKVELTTVEIPFSRETYLKRRQLSELGAKSNRAGQVWVVPAAVAEQARALVAPKARRASKPAPVVNVPPTVKLAAPPAIPAAPVKVETPTAVTTAPAYIGRPRAEFSSWLTDRGYQAIQAKRPAVQAEPAPVATIEPPKAVQAPAPRKVTPSPKAVDSRPLDERIEAIAANAEAPSRRQIGRHLVWLREIRLEDLKAAVQGMKQNHGQRVA